MKRFRSVLLIALTAAVLLGAADAGYLWWSRHAGRQAPATASTTATTPSSQSSATVATPAPASAGPTLPPIQLGPQRLQRIGVTTAVAARRVVEDEIRTTGNVEVDETRLSSVQLRFPGWIQKVFVNSTYQLVRKGQPLFTIYSPELVTTEQEYLLARQNQQLLAGSPVLGVSSGAASLLDAARQRLQQWEVPAREIAALERTGTPRQDLEIDSPATGYVTEWHALPQTYAQPQTRLYTIADLSTVWVYAAVFQTDIGRIRVGSQARVTVDAYPGRTFRGRVDYVWPQVDMATRTVKVRLVFPNPGIKLMPGMFVDVTIGIPLGRRLVIPASAVFNTGTRSVVFVDRGNGYLEPRTVQVGPRAGDDVVVLSGVKTGDTVVSSANFLIDSESQLQAAIGSFVPPPPGAGAAAAMNSGASPRATVTLTTKPSPARKGDNTVQVALTSSDGQPLTGAEVAVTFFMPAMPAMGMAAMRAQATLREESPGRYAAPLTLPSGGTWQVTIVGRRAGAVVASRRLTVSAAGGM